MMEQLVLIGIVMVFVGIVFIIIGSVMAALKSKQMKTESGGVILIGPFPIVWGSNKNMAILAVVITIIFLLLFVLLNLLGR